MKRQGRSPGGRVLRILIVEDGPERQAILQRLAKDHAWILASTAARAVRLLESYPFDLVFLDYDLAGDARGDRVAGAIRRSQNARARVIVHSQSAPGAKRIAAVLPEADLVPLSKITRSNATFKRLREEMGRGVDVDWEYVFSIGKCD
jgi:CheY-like chemotaxis protein